MRFLLDVNVGRRIAEALTAQGHDVFRAALNNPTMEDGDLLELARDGDRVLVTYDRDFGELLFARKCPTPPGLIYLRYRPRDVEAAIGGLLSALETETPEGYMVVIDDRRTRRTPLPMGNNDNG